MKNRSRINHPVMWLSYSTVHIFDIIFIEVRLTTLYASLSKADSEVTHTLIKEQNKKNEVKKVTLAELNLLLAMTP